MCIGNDKIARRVTGAGIFHSSIVCCSVQTDAAIGERKLEHRLTMAALRRFSKYALIRTPYLIYFLGKKANFSVQVHVLDHPACRIE